MATSDVALDFAQSVALNYNEVYESIVLLRSQHRHHSNNNSNTDAIKHPGARPRSRSVERTRGGHANQQVHIRLNGYASEREARIARLREASKAMDDKQCTFEPQINPSSRKLKRGSVVKDLMRWNENFKQRLEEKKVLHDREILKEMQTGPQINKQSARIANRRRPSSAGPASIATRSMQFKRQAQEKHEQIRRQLLEKENASMQASPAINKLSRRLVKARCVDDMMSWKASKEERLERERERKTTEDSSKLDFSPKLSTGSQRIAQRLPRSGSVGSRLYEQAQEYQRRKNEAQRQAEERSSHTPKVASHSKNIPRHGDVADRLYQMGRQRQQRRRATPWKQESGGKWSGGRGEERREQVGRGSRGSSTLGATPRSGVPQSARGATPQSAMGSPQSARGTPQSARCPPTPDPHDVPSAPSPRRNLAQTHQQLPLWRQRLVDWEESHHQGAPREGRSVAKRDRAPRVVQNTEQADDELLRSRATDFLAQSSVLTAYSGFCVEG